ncbi:MAG: tetratricopeptide repeat protein [Verrucomicrobia bacterium]|nr:tetratricopeptide repeat protein [Verrucomicrobiota bacterium]
MRYVLSISIGLGFAVSALSQDIPKGASPLPSSAAYDKVLKPSSESAPEEGPAKSLQMRPGEKAETPPSLLKPAEEISGLKSEKTGAGIYTVTTNAAPSPAPVAAADQIDFSKVNFLMDTGLQYKDAGEYEEAEKAYLRALEKVPGNPDIRFRLSTLYIQMKRYAQAGKILEELGKEFPDSPIVHNNLSWVYASGGEMKNGKLALLHAHEAILAAPYTPSIWNTLAEAYYVSGKYDEALQASDHAIGLLNMQEPSEADKASFAAQYAKIQRAIEAGKQLSGFGPKK